MNRTLRNLVAAALLAVACAALAAPSFAQDPLAAAPTMYKLVFENDRVRVMEVTFKVGEKIAPHSHPDHFVYVLEAGKLKISKPDGTSMEFDGKVGQVAWIGPETHWAENIGTTPMRALVVELKEPAKPMSKTDAAKPEAGKKHE